MITFRSDVWTCTKNENYAIIKQNYIVELFIALKMANLVSF